MPEFAYRRAELHDATAIAAVHVASWRAVYAGILGESVLQALSVSERAEGWRKWLNDPGQMTQLALGSEVFLGFASVTDCRDEDCAANDVGEITSIYLRPEFWGRGVGTALCRWCFEALQATGKSDVVLWVLAENANAIRFYEKLGFARDGSESKHEGLRKRVVRYRRRLVAEN